MPALSSLLLLAVSSSASAGIIIGNLGPDTHALHIEAENPLRPAHAQVFEGVTLTSCDASTTETITLTNPVFVTDWITFVVPEEDWCEVDIDLGPTIENVELEEDNDLYVGSFNTAPTLWDVTAGPADLIFSF